MGTTDEKMISSISSVYADLLSKRKLKEEEKAEQKRVKKELEEKEKEEKEDKEGKLTKKEKREKELDNWKQVIVGLTGDDLDYEPKKKSKKKYRKWIDDDDFVVDPMKKPKKPKKKNYNKEFEPELNMLKLLVREQNQYNADLQKRFQNAMGPATKDGQVPNKAMVDLASAIMSGRANSLGMLREIGNVKKTIAELYMKQKKLDSDLGKGNSNFDNSDVGLLGSSIAASMFGNQAQDGQYQQAPPQQSDTSLFGSPVMSQQPTQSVSAQQQDALANNISDFDPSTWQGVPDASDYSKYENIPHHTVVEKNKETGKVRFKVLRDDTNEELVGCPKPTSDPKDLKINEEQMTVKGQFDEVFPLVYA